MDTPTEPTPGTVPTVDRERIAQLGEILRARPPASKRSNGNAGPESMKPRLASNSPVKVEVEPVPCRFCGEMMAEAYQVGTLLVFTHLKICPEMERMERAEYLARNQQLQDRNRRGWSNLPPDVDGIGDFGAYCRRFAETEETAFGRSIAQRFLQAAGEQLPHTGFTLLGRPGTGKSTLLAAFGRSLLAAGIGVRWETGPELYSRCVGVVRRDQDLEEELERLIRVPVLLLDDLGREKGSPWWVDSVLFIVVDKRYRLGRPVVATTNYTWPELQAKYEGLTNQQGDEVHSAHVLVERLDERAASLRYGGETSFRVPGWDFWTRGAA